MSPLTLNKPENNQTKKKINQTNRNAYKQKEEIKTKPKHPQKASLSIVFPDRFYFQTSDARLFIITH